MSLVKYVNNRLNRPTLFDYFDNDFWNDGVFDNLSRWRMNASKVSEDENNYTLTMDMPGIEKKDLKVNYENGYLNISAQTSEKNNQRSYSETRYIGDIDTKNLDATLKNGVLTVTIPKPEKSRPKAIDVKCD